MSFSISSYAPPGPVAAAFLASHEFVRLLMGPIGSGKTNTCFFDALIRAATMPPCRDGTRRFKGLVIRDTYRELYSTTIKTWEDWFPRTMGEWSGSEDRPAVHKLTFELADGGMLELEMHFRAIGEQSVEDALRGLEVTWAYVNEADLCAPEILVHLPGRVGRFPKIRDFPVGVTFFSGIVLDCNAPDTDNYIYVDFVEKPKEGYAIFRQPGGRSPAAENVQNLPPRYYERICAANENQPWWIRRMVDNEFGASRAGLPVYPQFQDSDHVVPGMRPIEGLPIYFACDAGGTPAGVFFQVAAGGYMRVLDEFVPGHMGATAFGQQVADFATLEYPGFHLVAAWGDPSAEYGADTENGELAWLDTVAAQIGIPILPTEGNEIGVRIDAVRQLLTARPDGKTPSLQISDRCRMLRRGFNSNYRYKKLKRGQAVVYDRDKPEKNEFSHVHDALQYGALGWRGRNAVVQNVVNTETGKLRRNRGDSFVPSSDFDVFAA